MGPRNNTYWISVELVSEIDPSRHEQMLGALPGQQAGQFCVTGCLHIEEQHASRARAPLPWLVLLVVCVRDD